MIQLAKNCGSSWDGTIQHEGFYQQHHGIVTWICSQTLDDPPLGHGHPIPPSTIGYLDVPWDYNDSWLVTGDVLPTKYPNYNPTTTVLAMNISYNWLFQWDEIHSINGVTSLYL